VHPVATLQTEYSGRFIVPASCADVVVMVASGHFTTRSSTTTGISRAVRFAYSS
jgi:hypothetical protein